LASACSLRLAQPVTGLFGITTLVTRVIMQHDVAKFNVPNSVIVIAIKQKAKKIVMGAIFLQQCLNQFFLFLIFFIYFLF
jgi:hypothetical protein